MRNTGGWRGDVVTDLTTLKKVYGSLPLSGSELLDTELILTVMKQVFPEQNPELAWAVLNGHYLPALERLSEQHKKAVALTRLHLPSLIGRKAWEDTLKRYRTLSSPYPLYRLEESKILDQANAILPERYSIIQQALSTPPEWKNRKTRYPEAGRYRFSLNREWHEVELPPRASRIAQRTVPRLEDARVPEQQKLEISLADLQDEADWMDRVAPRDSAAADQSWGKRLRNIQLRLIDATGLRRSSHLTLDGLLHLIGMVGSGKSSLITVLTVYLARRGYRVAIVQNDVASLRREQAIFDALRQSDPLPLQALPLLGRSTRTTHLNRLYRTEAARDGVSIRRYHPAYPLLSTICPLDGLRQDVRPIQPGEEPCTRLYLADNGKDDEERWDCPFMPICPSHLSTRSLADARIWLATPASLLASGPQAPLLQENIRNIDLIMRHAHVVLIDEADLAQVQFDDRFAPMEVLVRERGESWLDRVAVQVTRHVYRSGRPLVGQLPGLDRWLISHDNTQRAVNRLYILLRDHDSTTRRWLGNSYFSHDRLIARLVWELRDILPSEEDFVRQAEYFKYNPLVGPLDLRATVGGGETPHDEAPMPPGAWYKALHLEMLESDTSLALEQLKAWLSQIKAPTAAVKDQQLDLLALHLLIMLLVITLDHAMQAMILQWPVVEGLEIDRGSGGLFYHPSEDQLRMVPEPPMGAVLGFQYYDSHEDGNGELRFFHIRGMGRSLLYHLHDTLKRSDDVAGPHVILTSGTSWAPGSWKYHLHEPPRAVLLPQYAGEQGTPRQPIQCFYDPLPDPDSPGKYLRVSGIEEPERRMRSLRAMVETLTRPQAFRPNMLDAELATLQEHRRRILLVVGSYDEADAVGETLANILTDQRQTALGTEVLTLIPDSEGEENDSWQPPPGKLFRSLLNQMPKHPAQFLVAPLQSIERGHNILVGQEAAIGSVYFLVRPYPVPGDIHTAIHKMNAWAMDYIPTLTDPQATRAGLQLRQAAREQWDVALSKGKGYKALNKEELRTPLLWTQFVLVWQCIGRLLRGEASARVHFVDARWAENSPMGQRDTEQTSMLLGFRRILQQAIADPDPARRAIATTLYGEAAQAFSYIQGVYHD
jgi:hypothetical protein